MTFSLKYSFNTEIMRETTKFELIIPQNLQRIDLRMRDIARIEYFTSIPGTLYPETGVFTADHPVGGSFGAHLYLNDGGEAWLYGRISYDPNPNADHFDGNPHWNFDVTGIKPNGDTIPAYTDFAYHGLPTSNEMNVNISESLNPYQKYTITR